MRASCLRCFFEQQQVQPPVCLDGMGVICNFLPRRLQVFGLFVFAAAAGQTHEAVVCLPSVCLSLNGVRQILGDGGLRPVVSAGSHVVLRPLLHQRGLDRHGVPIHYIQHFSRNVYLHLPLPPSEKGKRFFLSPTL